MRDVRLRLVAMSALLAFTSGPLSATSARADAPTQDDMFNAVVGACTTLAASSYTATDSDSWTASAGTSSLVTKLAVSASGQYGATFTATDAGKTSVTLQGWDGTTAYVGGGLTAAEQAALKHQHLRGPYLVVTPSSTPITDGVNYAAGCGDSVPAPSADVVWTEATTGAGVTYTATAAADGTELASVYSYEVAGGIPTLITGRTVADGYVYTTNQAVTLSTATTVPMPAGYTRVSAATVAAAVRAYTIAQARAKAVRQVTVRARAAVKVVNAWAARQHRAPVTVGMIQALVKAGKGFAVTKIARGVRISHRFPYGTARLCVEPHHGKAATIRC